MTNFGGQGTMPPDKSGYYYPNKFALITIEAMEEIMGKNGLNAILQLAKLPTLLIITQSIILKKVLTLVTTPL